MESLSSVSRILYDLLTTESKEEYERRFLDYKKDMLDSIKPFVADTTSQLRTVRTAVESIRSYVGVDLEDVKAHIGGEIDNMRESLGSEIAQLVAAVGRLSHPDPCAREAAPTATPTREPGGSSAGPEGHRYELQHRGTACEGAPPPVTGMRPAYTYHEIFSSPMSKSVSTDLGFGSRVDLPQFDGSNPKLWQRRCEEAFQRGQAVVVHWALLASDQFIGPAATWLESYLQQQPHPTWS